MNRAVNPIQITNTKNIAGRDVKSMALSVQNSLDGLPYQVRERQRFTHEARNRGDTNAINQIASNLALSQTTEPPPIKPLIRHHNAKEMLGV